jgi:hypothetical protein
MALEGPRVEVSRLYKLIGGLQEQLDGLYTRLEELSAEIDGLQPSD